MLSGLPLGGLLLLFSLADTIGKAYFYGFVQEEEKVLNNQTIIKHLAKAKKIDSHLLAFALRFLSF